MSDQTAFQYGLALALDRHGYSPDDLSHLNEVAVKLEKKAFWPLALGTLAGGAALGAGALAGQLAKPFVVDLPHNVGEAVGQIGADALDSADPVESYKSKRINSELDFQSADARRRIGDRLRKLLERRPDLQLSDLTGEPSGTAVRR